MQHEQNSEDAEMQARIAAFVAQERARKLVPDPEQREIDNTLQSHGQQKSNAALLWLLTGFMGGHRFYFKSYPIGIIQATLFAASVLPFFGVPILSFGNHMVAILLCFCVWMQDMTQLRYLVGNVQFEHE